ncbi:MAG: bifunctional 2-C-methyl-D-erythritol 4-phosphate cytidylyltransferase/2-C-methyl-D-erythritol 2,4-cyclodiphosphate synthase [Kordiimonas sp.]
MPEVVGKIQSKIELMKHRSIGIVIVAAGRGSRAQTELPKQYCTLLGKTVLTRTLEAVIEMIPSANIVVVIHPDDEELYQKATSQFSDIIKVIGGQTRQQSVRNGLASLEIHEPDYVLVHDAARPFLSRPLIANLKNALDAGSTAVIPALPITDTLKKTNGNRIEATVDRNGLYSVQTPQAFNFKVLLDAHKSTEHANYTDDAAVVEANGHDVHICTGSQQNFKITRPEDFKKAEAQIMMSCADIRVGSGYDVHQFEDGDGPWLCGVKVPHKLALKGHSDADVGLHALTDAILSAIAEGDIGTHFPPSDKQWRGVESSVFLEHASKLVADRGGIISHVTVCLICEEPKVGPHKDAMRTRIAEIINVDVSRVSVQATTTEKLGFTGRSEGIAAQATATVRLPLKDI